MFSAIDYILKSYKDMKLYTFLLVLANFCGLCYCKIGVVKEVFFGQVFSCSDARKFVKLVKSEIQCVHFCLRYGSCEVVNYIEQNDDKRMNQVCEIFSVLTTSPDCILLDHSSKSKAMVLERLGMKHRDSLQIPHVLLETNSPGLPSISTYAQLSSVSPSYSSVSALVASSSCCALATTPAYIQSDSSMALPSLSSHGMQTSEVIAATPSSTGQTSTQAPTVYRSCQEIYNMNVTTLQSKAYSLESGKHYCAMGSLGECGGGGWTLAMAIDGSRDTFEAGKSIWMTDQTYNNEDAFKEPFSMEAKYPAFNSISFNEVCIGVKHNSVLRWIKFAHHASALRNIFHSNTYMATSKGKTAWKGLIDGSSLQYNCVKEGFNVKNGQGTITARVGIIADNVESCSTPNSYIGLGTQVDISYFCSGSLKGVSCGNFAMCSTDNGPKSLATYGYIFVK